MDNMANVNEIAENTVPTEPVKTIGFGDNLITVTSVYVYKDNYGKGRKSLRIEVPENDITLEQIEDLKNNEGTINYYVDGELKANYEGYTSDLSYSYQNGKYNIEIQRIDETTAMGLENAASIRWLTEQIMNISEIAQQAAADAAYAAIMVEPVE